MKTAENMGYKKLVSYSTSPAFNKIAQETGLPVKASQSQQVIGGKAVPAFQYEVTV
jgi:N-acyl-L-homoserine lactone synthetase